MKITLKVPSGQIGSASEWYHWKGLEEDINRYRFLIFDFWFWIFGKTSKFWAASYKNASNPPTCWDHGLYGHIPQSFPPNRATKMREIQQLFLGLRLVCKEFHHSAIQTKIEENFGGFFHQIKVRQPIGRKDSKQPVVPTSKRIRCIFVWRGSELVSLLKYSRTKLKNQKHIAVDVLFKAYPMILLSGWSNLAGRYLK